MTKNIDFTNCPRLFDRAYNGANGKKIAVEYQGRPYMLKFPPSGDGKPTELSYTNSCISEHIASSIFNMLGVKAQETMLGTFTVNGKEKIVCACLDFTEDGKKFYDFCSIKNTVLDSDSNGSGTELSDILEAIERQQFVDPIRLKTHFWEMFAVDALLGNFDRHNGNWGFLYDPKNDRREIAPVYDCGSCLLPQADDAVMRAVLTDKEALDLRIYRFPTSAIKLHGSKINYYDFLSSGEYEECDQAVREIYERVDMDQIGAFIDDVPHISELQKKFYKQYIAARVDLILRPVFEMTESLETERSGPTMSL